MGTKIVSFNPWIEGDLNFFQFSGLTPEVIAALREAEIVIFPQTVSPELYFFARQLGKRVFPNYDLRFAFPGKIGQIMLFEALSLPHPRTICVPRICAFGPHPGAAEIPFPPYPFVVKGNHGHEGREVFLVESSKDWEEILRILRTFEASGRYGFLIQEYLPWDYDLRVVVIGERFMPFWRKGRFLKNLVQEGEVAECPDRGLEVRALEIVRELCRRTGFNLMAVDFLFRPETGEALLNEINFVFGLRLLGGEENFRVYLREAVEKFLSANS